MADFLAIKSHFEGNNLSFFTFYPKSEKPIKAVIRHLPISTPAEDKCDGLVSLSFDVVNVKQMTTTRRSPPEEPKISNLPFPGNLAAYGKIPTNLPTAKPLPHCNQGGSLQIAKRPHAVPQLSAVRPRLGKL
jgi:hypothetical protein